MNLIKLSALSGVNIGDVFISKAIESLMDHDDLLSYDMHFSELKSNNAFMKSNNFKWRIIKRLKANALIYNILCRVQYYLKYKKRIEFLANDNDILVLGGGNILFNKNGIDYLWLAEKYTNKFSAMGKKIIVYGVGVGPFSLPYRSSLRRIVKKADLVLVRDSMSYKILKQYDEKSAVYTTYDPAFIVSDIYPKRDSRGERSLGINVMDLRAAKQVGAIGQDIDILCKNISKISDALSLKIKIINTAYNNDYRFSQRISEKLINDSNKEVSIINVSKDADLGEIYGSLDLFLAYRLHSSIFALSYNIKTLIYGWQQKIESIYSDLFGERKNDFLLSSPNFDFKEVMEKIEGIEIVNSKKIIQNVKNEIYKDAIKVKQMSQLF